jgi:hypothetical protein
LPDLSQKSSSWVNKKNEASLNGSFFLAGVVTRRWNTLLPSLILMADKLETLGLVYYNGEVTMIATEEAENV